LCIPADRELTAKGLEDAEGRLQLTFMLSIHRKDHKLTGNQRFIGTRSVEKSVVCTYELASFKPPGFPTLRLRTGDPSGKARRTASEGLFSGGMSWRNQPREARTQTENHRCWNLFEQRRAQRYISVRWSLQALVQLNTLR